MKKILSFSTASIVLSSMLACQKEKVDERPNVILFLADDVGYGDVAFHGNPYVKTPRLDKFAKEGIEFSNFYVAPASSPTRAGILTGRYYYRTKVMDVGDEVCKMSPEEITIAEALRGAGYATGFFGKWHLGDNYPMRPSDQGFEEVLHHSFCQITDDYPVGNSYFNPWLFHNNQMKKYEGYCLDVYIDEMMAYIRKCMKDKKPFFVYLPSTLAHIPLQIDKKYYKPYLEMGLKEKTAKFYGMMANIDYNFGRMLDSLKLLGIDQNTIVIFTSDNGPCGGSIEDDRYMAGLRGLKVMVYENGIKVPCLMQWPAKWKGERKLNERAGYIDIFPTLLDACGVELPMGPVIDGISLSNMLTGKVDSLPKRSICNQLELPTVEQPLPFENFAIFKGDYKLVQAFGRFHVKTKSYNEICSWQNRPLYTPTKEPVYELFNITKDSGEWNNVAEENPEVVEQLKREYLAWYYDVFSSRGMSRPMYKLNYHHENPAIFTTNKWLESKVWEVIVETPGKYDIRLVWGNEKKNTPSEKMIFKIGKQEFIQSIQENQHEIVLNDIDIKEGYLTFQIIINEAKNKLSSSIIFTRKED